MNVGQILQSHGVMKSERVLEESEDVWMCLREGRRNQGEIAAAPSHSSNDREGSEECGDVQEPLIAFTVQYLRAPGDNPSTIL